ncbi:hypothetical protein QTP88_012517 [Uroleucon formosanum]
MGSTFKVFYSPFLVDAFTGFGSNNTFVKKTIRRYRNKYYTTHVLQSHYPGGGRRRRRNNKPWFEVTGSSKYGQECRSFFSKPLES